MLKRLLAVLFMGSIASHAHAGHAVVEERSIDGLRAGALVKAYLDRIRRIDRAGPRVRSIARARLRVRVREQGATRAEGSADDRPDRSLVDCNG
jgi:hypothetical protein